MIDKEKQEQIISAFRKFVDSINELIDRVSSCISTPLEKNFLVNIDITISNNPKHMTTYPVYIKPNTLPLQNRKRVYHIRNCC